MRKASKAKLKTTDGKSSHEAIEEMINQQVPLLFQYVERELAYSLATGDLTPDAVQAESVVDETVMRALSHYLTRPTKIPFDRWLMALANEVLNQRLQQEQLRREAAGYQDQRVEQRLSRIPPELRGAAVEDEMYNWYQPDEKLHLEDIVADPHISSPEEIAASRQFQQELDQIIAFLPKRWRDVFVLHNIEDFTLEQVCLVTGQTLEEVQQDLQAAREFLRERLTVRKLATSSTYHRAMASHR